MEGKGSKKGSDVQNSIVPELDFAIRQTTCPAKMESGLGRLHFRPEAVQALTDLRGEFLLLLGHGNCQGGGGGRNRLRVTAGIGMDDRDHQQGLSPVAGVQSGSSFSQLHRGHRIADAWLR
jgi:hypothetical protein